MPTERRCGCSRRSFLWLTAGAVGMQGPLASAALAKRSPAALRFDLRSSFWMNLHHRLYFQAQAYEAARHGDRLDAERDVWGSLANVAYREYRELSVTQRAIWERAMGAYIDRGYADADLLGDFMPAIDAALSDVKDDAQPVTSGSLRTALVDALTAAAPIYKATLWERDDRANRAWIAAVSPLIAAHGATLSARLFGWYQTPWPSGPYRVDVTSFANWAGFYTNTDPIHTVASPRDLRNNVNLSVVPNTGLTALEMVFHEASHTVITPGYGTIGTAIENAASELGVTEPEGLWHAVIFYTAGRAVIDEAARASVPYTMIADAVDIYTRGWRSYRAALVEHWQPYLDGRNSLAAALTSVVAAARS